MLDERMQILKGYLVVLAEINIYPATCSLLVQIQVILPKIV